MKRIYVVIVVFTLGLFLQSCTRETQVAMSYAVPETVPDVAIEEQEIEHVTHEVTLTAVGDLMFHEYQLQRSYNAATDTFDFSDTFPDVIPYLTASNFTIGNLETTLAGTDSSRKFNTEQWVGGYSGYPCFNTPDVVIDTIKEAGFDLLTTANNHSLDSHVTGLKRTLDILDEKGILHMGTYRTQDESEQIQMVEINSIKFAFISFTYAMNGFETPEDEPYIIHSLDMYAPEKEEAMCELVRKAEALDPDFIVVMPHFGNEYQEFPNSYQEELVDKLFTAGADIILGSHPHVLEPIDIKEVTREDGTKAQGFVIYSLGNFISSQMKDSSGNKDLGVMLKFYIEKTDLQEAKITGFSLVPTYTYRNSDTIGVLPVDETLDKINHQVLSMPTYDVERMEFAKTYSVSHLISSLSGLTQEMKGYEHYFPIQ